MWQEDDRVKTEAEIGVMLPQGKPGAAKAGGSKEGSFPGTFRGSAALPTPWFLTSILQTERE